MDMYRPGRTIEYGSTLEKQSDMMLKVALSDLKYIESQLFGIADKIYGVNGSAADDDARNGEHMKDIARKCVIDAIRLSNEPSELSGRMKEILLPVARKYGVAGYMGETAEA